MTDPAASTAAVAFAVEVFGGLHVAHLNAGVTSWCGMGDDFDPEAYRRSMAIDLDGVVYGIAAARPAIMASGGGTIVATASPAGWWPLPSTRYTRPTSMPSWDWSARWGQVLRGGRASAFMRCARRSPTPTSSRGPNRRCSTWASRSSTWPRSWGIPAHPRRRFDRPAPVRRRRAPERAIPFRRVRDPASTRGPDGRPDRWIRSAVDDRGWVPPGHHAPNRRHRHG